MNKKALWDINKVLVGLIKISMRETIDVMWDRSEEELINNFEMVMDTPDDENRPGLFVQMQIARVIGTVLNCKYGKDENELMKMLKNSDALFVKEIKEKANETSMGGNRKE